MIVRVKCFTGMRRFAPHDRHEFDLEFDTGASVASLLERLGVPAATNAIVAVNGARAQKHLPLHDGDAVILFTPMEGG